MDRVEVAVRRPQGPDERLRVGAVLSRTGTLARVRWNDDDVVEENVRLGGENLLAVVGTRRHQFLMDLPSLIERFTADPVTVVLDLLRESPKGLKAPAIKELLVELGLDPAIVDRTWRSLQARLARHDDVQIKANTYRWKRPDRTRDAVAPSSAPASPEPSAPDVSPQAPAPEAAGSPAPEVIGSPAPEAAGSPAPTSVPAPFQAASAVSEPAPEPSRAASAVPETVLDAPREASAVPEATSSGTSSTGPAIPQASAVARASAAAVSEVPEKADVSRTAAPSRENDPADKKADRKADKKAGRKNAPKGDEAAGPSVPVGRSGPSEAAEERVQALAERYERLERDLRTAEDRATGLRTAQERRIRLDGVRALADLAAETEEMVTAGATPETVVGRVRDLAALQALRPIGTAGEETGFDPAAHEPLIGTLEPGTPVRVVRPGYHWVTSEETLLHRALVERSHA
ncbi:hypothetical protein ACLQ2R_26050 [Streptosporangium sp. DT93]|uniref:hypothetical protein n=1 Tax=Streptosporangium sp. DT93 TaxID=3393428 RepID=UPI003CEBFA36